MKTGAVIAVFAVSVSAFSEEQVFEIGLWAGPEASSRAEVSEIYEHHACIGDVARTHINRLPTSWDESSPLQPERVEELGPNGEAIQSWPMAVDMYVAGIRGESIYVRPFFRGGVEALRIDLDGLYMPESMLGPYEARNVKCPVNSELEVSAYRRCFVFRDLTSGELRLVRDQGPCT